MKDTDTCAIIPGADDPLTPAELAFRRLLADPQALHRWAERARQRWELNRAGGRP